MKYSVYTINSTYSKFVTVRKEIKVEVVSDDEPEALRTKRGLPTSVSTPHRGPRQNNSKNLAWKRQQGQRTNAV